MKTLFGLLIAVIAASTMVVGCSEDNDGDNTTLRRGAAPAYLAKNDGSQADAGDFGCDVVLRQVSRSNRGPGYATTCDLGLPSSGGCLYVWEGTVDVAADAVFERVEVLYHTLSTGSDWYIVEAQPTAGADEGFVRYAFLLDAFTPAAGMSMTSLSRTEIDLIPYLVTADNQRLFDHNRIADPLGTYALRLQNNWSLADDAAVCHNLAPQQTVIHYTYPEFTQTVENGPAKAGSTVRVRYDARRLRDSGLCMGSQAAASSTTIMMGYEYGGSVVEEVIEHYTESYGYACNGTSPCINQVDYEPQIELTAGDSELEIWFYCIPGFSSGGSSNWNYDSNYGSNYHVPIESGRQVDWAGEWQMHAARSGFTFPVDEPYLYHGYTNMGWSVQFQVYVRGLTDQSPVDTTQLKVFIETDMTSCQPGGALQLQELSPSQERVGVFGNNTLYRWGIEGLINNCPTGTYRYRFLLSADGGSTRTPFGLGETLASPDAGAFRTIIFD